MSDTLPPNLKGWRAGEELVDDPRWAGYDVPPTGNANYAWILHMIAKLSEQGVAGFVLANGSMSTNTKGEGAIRRQILDNDLVDCMVALPGQLFYTTQIPVCLWFLTKNKAAQVIEGHADSDHRGPKYRERCGQTLFIDARAMGTMIDRTHKELTTAELAEIARTYHAWRGQAKDGTYEDKPGFCKSATLAEIAAHDYVLTPGRYVGAAPVADDGEPFEEKMARLAGQLGQGAASIRRSSLPTKNNFHMIGPATGLVLNASLQRGRCGFDTSQVLQHAAELSSGGSTVFSSFSENALSRK